VTQAQYRWHLPIIVGVWAVSQVGTVIAFGLRIGADTPRYVDAAERLLRLEPLGALQYHALAYEALLALVIAPTGDPHWIVPVQAGLALAAALALHALGAHLWSPTAGLAAALAYLANPYLQRWNVYVLSETLGTTLLVFTVTAAVLSRQSWPVLTAGILLALSRPEGPALLVPISAYLYRARRAVALTLLAVAGLIVLARPDDYSGLVLSQLGECVVPARPSLTEPTWRVVGCRVWYHLLHVRDYSSMARNLATATVVLGMYALAVVAAWRTPRSRPVAAMIGGLFAVQLGVAIGTGVDWAGRWLDRVLPLVGVLSGVGLISLAGRGAASHGSGQNSRRTGRSEPRSVENRKLPGLGYRCPRPLTRRVTP
jgi:hypothetical protein